jgi:regulator of cell morphogenesis and NO signaling
MKYTTQNTLAEIVKADFRTARIFENYNLDFCCRGNRTVEEAAKEKGLDSEKILSEILTISPGNNETINTGEWNLDELVNHIIEKHHTYVKQMLPVINAHSQKVKEVHGSNHPEVIRIADIFEQVQNELELHLMKEEKMLFPAIIRLTECEKNNSAPEVQPFGSVSNPVSVMEREHTEAGEELYKIRELSGNYNPPEDACTTYRILYQELREFEEDLHRHIHLENNILFPGAVSLEQKLSL